MRRTAPLFRPDAGWLFVAAGLAVCAAGVILPAQSDLKTLQQQLDTLRTEESRAYARLKAYNDFLDELDEEDPALVRRLAASQLNIVPASDRPVLLSTAQIAPVTDWIEATVAYDPPAPRPLPDSTLSRLSNGPLRLWLFAGGIMCVFVGLLMGTTGVRLSGRRPAVELDEARLDREDWQIEPPVLEPAEAEAAAANEVATVEAAESPAAIDELAREIAAEIEAPLSVESDMGDLSEDDAEVDDDIDSAHDDADADDEDDDALVLEFEGAEDDAEDDDSDNDDEDDDATDEIRRG